MPTNPTPESRAQAAEALRSVDGGSGELFVASASGELWSRAKKAFGGAVVAAVALTSMDPAAASDLPWQNDNGGGPQLEQVYEDGAVQYANADTNIRAQPTTDAGTRGVVQTGTAVAVEGVVAEPSDGYEWTKVDLGGGDTGYIASTLLSQTPIPDAPGAGDVAFTQPTPPNLEGGNDLQEAAAEAERSASEALNSAKSEIRDMKDGIGNAVGDAAKAAGDALGSLFGSDDANDGATAEMEVGGETVKVGYNPETHEAVEEHGKLAIFDKETGHLDNNPERGPAFVTAEGQQVYVVDAQPYATQDAALDAWENEHGAERTAGLSR